MGRSRRRQPQRVPITRNIGNSARIRAIVDAQHYMLDIGSRIGAPVIGFYIGALVLAEGERVLATWREESELWEIIGPIRKQQQSGGVNLAILQPVGGERMEVIRWDEASGFTDLARPAVFPASFAYGVEFSPDGRFLAVVDDTTDLMVYDMRAGTIGAQLDLVNLSGATTTQFLQWSPDGQFILVSQDESGGDDKYAAIYSWNPSTETLTLVADMVGETSSLIGHGVAWDVDGTVAFFNTSTGLDDLNAFAFDGATATVLDTSNVPLVTPVSMQITPDGTLLITGETSAIGSRGLGAIPWDGVVFGAIFYPAATAPNVHDLEVSPDGQWAAVAINASPFLRVYPLTASAFGTPIDPAGGDIPPGATRGVSWHPDGAHLFASFDSGGAQLPFYAVWDFDGVALDNRQDGPNATPATVKNGYAIHALKLGAAVPTEQLDASEITYDPADPTDWDTVPDDVAEALDELADRLTGLSRIVDLPLNSFVVHTGTPAYAQVGTNMHAWALDDTIDELMVYSFTVPPKYASGGFFRLYYVMASATANEVVVSADALPAVEGDDFDAAGTAATATDTVQAGDSDDLGVVDVTPAVTYAAGDRVRAIVGRLGADGDDDAVGDMWLVGVEFRYTAAL